ncbi:MAG: SURF1 family protein [Alphaproteobacteria bacterium]|nr:MAG: SURF1 family protein [Alphaproteobacteria bacterium]
MNQNSGTFPRTLLVLIVMLYGVLSYLGIWQIKRHHETQNAIIRVHANQREPIVDLDGVLTSVAARAVVEGDDLRTNHYYRRVRISGTFQHDREMHVYPRSHEVSYGIKKAGFDVVTPFQLENGTQILVNRGWVPVDIARDQFMRVQIDRPEGEIVLMATILPVPRKSWFSPDNKPSKNQWFKIDYHEIVKHTGMHHLMPVYVMCEPYQLNGDLSPQNLIQFPIMLGYKVNIRNTHLMYAGVWYFLSFVLLGMALAYYRRWYHRADTHHTSFFV